MKLHTISFKTTDVNGEEVGDEVGTYVGTYTPEEAYQGCRPIFAPVDGWFASTANQWHTQKDRSTQQLTNADENPNFNKALKNEALKVWMSQKYGKSRSVTLQTN